jgi:hypothetical protein
MNSRKKRLKLTRFRFYSILLGIAILTQLTSGCIVTKTLSSYIKDASDWLPSDNKPYFGPKVDDSSAVVSPGEGGSSSPGGGSGYLDDESTQGVVTVQDSGITSGSGELKPVGFVNYGEFDATVRAYTFIPLGATEPAVPPVASTVSSANDGVGTWPNTSRFISVPMGAYSWCIDWEEGDIDEDGQIDYFHYIQNDPTILDENDSDELDFAQEVAINAPPASGAIYEGKCKPQLVDNACVGNETQVNVYSHYALEQDNPPEIFTYTNVADNIPPDGIQISVGGVSTAWGDGMILWQAGDYVEASTSNPYTAIGGQIHGDQTIGWARALFDGNEIWRGDASSYTIAEGRYGVYVEVSCLSPGTHTLRIEALGINGSGGGMSIPASYFGFSP